MNLRTRGEGLKNPENSADVLNGWPLSPCLTPSVHQTNLIGIESINVAFSLHSFTESSIESRTPSTAIAHGTGASEAEVITTARFYCFPGMAAYCADRGAAEDLQLKEGSLGLGNIVPNCCSKPSFTSIFPGVVGVPLMLMHAHP